ncbi:hypothetical protein ACEQ8H_005893 [Pleosporales sp. CAS-2024a]
MAESVKLLGGDSKDAKRVIPQNTTPGKLTSPVSQSSGDALYEDERCEMYRGETSSAQSLSSPLSPDGLDFDGLSITESGQRPIKGGALRYTNPFQRGLKGPNDVSRFSYSPTDRRDGPLRIGSQLGVGRGGFKNSHRWMSPDAQATQEFMMVRNAMRRQFKSSDVAKWKYSDYIAHREAMVASQANLLANKVKAREDVRLRVEPIPLELQQNLHKWGIPGNFNQQGNLSRVLGEQTIWCNDWQEGKDDIAPWPSIAELKWEGDDRAKTGVGRYPPLPREHGPPGLPWNQLPCVEQYPLDQVARIPTMEDVYLPVDDQIEEAMQYLWSKELEKDMDDYLDS